MKSDLRGYDHRQVERQRCHTDRGAGVLPSSVAEDLDDGLGERIDNRRRLAVPRLGLHEPADCHPRRDAVKIANGLSDATDHRQCSQPSCCLRLFESDDVRDSTERAGWRPIQGLRPVSGDQCPIAEDAYPTERGRNTWRHPRGSWKLQSKIGDSLLDAHATIMPH
jgi:hypothetical protein